MCDLIWSDPLPEETAEGLGEEDMEEWYSVGYEPNPDRGCGNVFGYAGIHGFLEANGYVAVIRGHEVKPAGYEVRALVNRRWGGGRSKSRSRRKRYS